MATPLLKKLNHKEHQKIALVNAPEEFKMEIDLMEKAGQSTALFASDEISKAKELAFILSFVQTKDEIEKICKGLEESLLPDAIVWFAYPKGTSKKYKAEINRDKGWEALGKKGFEAVRSIAIDTDWTGIRFRQVDFIKTMKRNTSLAMTEKGRARTTKKK
jgi:hypothetical protein